MTTQIQWTPGLQPPPLPPEDRIWNAIHWTVRQALRFDNRSPIDLGDGCKGLWVMMGPKAAVTGVAIYFTRRGELRAELHQLFAGKKGLGSKLLADTVVRETALGDLLLKWGERYELT